MQFSHGCDRLHFNFLCRHGPHDKGTLFLFRTTRNCASGDWPPILDEVVEGGVGVIADAVYFKDR